MPETIYFDTCALNRFTDDLSQPRVFAEAKAVEKLYNSAVAGNLRWITSSAVRLELSANYDLERREQMLPLLDFAHQELALQQADHLRASALQAFGLVGFDALHLACCERAEVDVLLTVDDKFIRRAARLGSDRRLKVINPIEWLARRSV